MEMSTITTACKGPTVGFGERVYGTVGANRKTRQNQMGHLARGAKIHPSAACSLTH